MTDAVTAALPRHLTPFVEAMVGYRITGASPGTHVGMPSGTVTLVLSLDAPLDLTPAGASLLLGGPAAELAGTAVDLAALIGPDAGRLHERLSGTEDWRERFGLVTNALFARREPRRRPQPEVEHAWRLLQRTAGRAPVHEVAREVGWSTRHLAARFRAEYGHAPKTTARVMRFQRSRRFVGAGRALADVAAVCGYADQSHLTRDWIALAGVPPTRWRREDEIAFVQDVDVPDARG